MATKVIYIYPKRASFINRDIAFLKEKYEVVQQQLPWYNPILLPLNFLKQFFFLLIHVKKSKAIIISFAGYFSVLPVFIGKFFKVKTLVILNGTECTALPEYNYGSLRKRILKWCVKLTFQNATKLLPVDASLTKQVHTYDEAINNTQQGYLNFFPKNKTPYAVLPNGFDIGFWDFSESSQRTGYITVASIGNLDTAKLKGIDTLLDIAKENLNQQFTIVGMDEHMQRTLHPSKNVKIYPFVSKEVLKELYATHEFYVQLSISEGFGCALAEAMLCGCIPIVSNVGALPNVVGDTGYVVSKKDNEKINFIFGEAYRSKNKENQRIKARKRIVENFPISKREELLLHEIEQ